MTNNEMQEFVKMMMWAQQNPKIKSMNVKTEKNPIGKDIYVITSWSYDKRANQGTGETLTKAMQGYSKNIPIMGLIEKVFNEDD